LEATRKQLDAAGRSTSPLGQVALLLAAWLDSGGREGVTGRVALVREHRVALAEAVKGAQRVASPVDELRARRDFKRNAG